MLLTDALVEQRIAEAVAALLRHGGDDAVRGRAAVRLALLAAKLDAEGRRLPLDYRDRVEKRLGEASGR